MIDYTIMLVAKVAAISGFLSGIVGAFAVLRQQSLLADAISHAAFPGIVCMFLVTHSKDPWILLCGGAAAAVLGILFMQSVMRYSRLKKDAILGILLSVFFGCGLVLMTVVQKCALSGQAVLNKFLFGNITTVLLTDLYIYGAISTIIFVFIVVFYRQYIVYIFDPSYGIFLGFSSIFIECLLYALFVVTIIIGLQAVGVVLMSTMLIAPAVAARQWTNRVFFMILLSGFLASASAVVGVLVSVALPDIPTGPSIVVVSSCCALVSLIVVSCRRKGNI